MTATINASTSSGLIQTADTSGTLALQSNGTTQLTVSSTGAYGQLKSGTAQASTSGTSIDFTSIPSWVKRITVQFSGVSTSGTSALLLQAGSGSVTTSGYAGFGINYSTGGISAASQTAGIPLGNTMVAAAAYSGTGTISLISGTTWVGNSFFGSGSSVAVSGSGTSPAFSGALDRIRITTVNGTDTFDAGSINILYEG